MTSNSTRKLICLRHQATECSVIDHVEVAGWQVLHVDDVEQVMASARRDDIHVGVVVLTGNEPAEWTLRTYATFSRITSIEWIAVVSEQLLDEPQTCDFLVDHFLDYHTLPVDSERLLHSIGHAYGMATLLPATRSPKRHKRLIGDSEAMRQIHDGIERVAAVDAPVLITGETGTGKELIASEIHNRSMRRDGPFVAVNCAELPSSLIHAELFGHEKGAFTGANKRKTGYLEKADGGTIFLDEIGDLSIELQILLLRFLQEKTLRRVGSGRDIKVDAHVIAATHVDLPAAVQELRFREDLYHRLNVLHLEVPPLHDRTGDIEQLAYHFLEMFSHESRMNVRGFTRSAIDAMNRYDWPGNIRELMNRVRRALVMSNSRMLTAADLGIRDEILAREMLPPKTLEQARLQAERNAIVRALEYANGQVQDAASMLSVSRATLYRLMAKYGIGSSGHTPGLDANQKSEPEVATPGPDADSETQTSPEPFTVAQLHK